ncbi:MAG: radical SAM protein [Candidatus Anstonellales archaeon]
MSISEILYKRMEKCDLCPRKCGVNRMAGQKGYCKVNGKPVVSSYFPHHGEEKVIRGWKGSGTIFFTGCNLGCIFCQNFDISHLMHGYETSVERIVEMMLELEREGCHNINLVTPTHQIAFIVDAIEKAREMGLRIPIVYNTGTYDSPDVIKMLDGVVEIYMPDFKFMDRKASVRYLGAPDYGEVASECIKEMYKQKGGLKVKNGIAVEGVLIRHLVMPNHTEDSKRIMDWIKENAPDAAVNVMAQYFPYYRAKEFPEINRRITVEEYAEVLEHAKRIGLNILEE